MLPKISTRIKNMRIRALNIHKIRAKLDCTKIIDLFFDMTLKTRINSEKLQTVCSNSI